MASFLSYAFLLLALTSSFSNSSGESSRKELRTNEESIIRLPSSIQNSRVDPSRVVQLSWQPRVFLYKGFLTEEECDHLISLAQGAKAADDAGEIRKYGLIPNSNDNIIAKIEERISAWTFLPKENGRPIEVMHYGIEKGKRNLDYFGNRANLSLREPLMASIVLYLSNATQGGEILFPQSKLKAKSWSDCLRSSNVLRPVKGNAILFFTVNYDASPDTSSSHARCPVLEGDLWCATKLFLLRASDGRNSASESDGSECTDEHDSCPGWAALGECERNPVFMVGSPDYYGTCRKSCNVC